MKKMITLLEGFNLNTIQTPEDLNLAFTEIAKQVLFGGHFLIDNELSIYPCDIEFYCHSDKPDAPEWKKDYGMYHTGDLPYFPKCSLFPHNSGIDFRFEDEEEKFRASFLIRGYEFKDPNALLKKDKEGRESHPTYLWEDLFGACRFNGNGLNIQWVDDDLSQGEPETDFRSNLCKYDAPNKPTVPEPGEETMEGREDRVQDTRPWHFKR